MRRLILSLTAWLVVLLGFTLVSPPASLQQRSSVSVSKAELAISPDNTRSPIRTGLNGLIRTRSRATSGARRVACSRSRRIGSTWRIAAS
jgi:hypothetical protein